MHVRRSKIQVAAEGLDTDRVATIAFVAMFNSYGLMDRILTGDGNSSRIFLTIDELILALNDSGIASDILTDHLTGLRGGLSFEIRVTRMEANLFYKRSDPERSPVGVAVIH